MSYSRVFVAILLLGACHHDKKAVTLPTPAAPPPTTAKAAPAPARQDATPVSPNLSADADLMQQCQLAVGDQQAAPKFDFDQADLTSQDRDVLQRVATCVTTGPLKGKQLKLVGRADPRGTEEYNLGLGDRRAHQVSSYLERLGVKQMHETTRGALDAKGHDEDTWAQDRRVDLSVN